MRFYPKLSYSKAVLLLQGGNWLQQTRFALGQFFASDNPLVRWMLILDLLLLLAYVYSVYWVYRDALVRYRRGAPWAAAAAFFPVAGWIFYLFYRVSPLVQLDRIEAETFNEDEEPWTDYDSYQANRGSELFREMGRVWRKPEGRGYNEAKRVSRLRELGKLSLTPEEREARNEQRRQDAERRKQQAAERVARRKTELAHRKAGRTMLGAHGFKFQLSERSRGKLQQKLKVYEQLQRLPREDPQLEELIYHMNYTAALATARDALQIARELGDQQGQITYEHYIRRIEKLLTPED